jgi:hypothetical protein
VFCAEWKKKILAFGIFVYMRIIPKGTGAKPSFINPLESKFITRKVNNGKMTARNREGQKGVVTPASIGGRSSTVQNEYNPQTAWRLRQAQKRIDAIKANLNANFPTKINPADNQRDDGLMNGPEPFFPGNKLGEPQQPQAGNMKNRPRRQNSQNVPDVNANALRLNSGINAPASRFESRPNYAYAGGPSPLPLPMMGLAFRPVREKTPNGAERQSDSLPEAANTLAELRQMPNARANTLLNNAKPANRIGRGRRGGVPNFPSENVEEINLKPPPMASLFNGPWPPPHRIAAWSPPPVPPVLAWRANDANLKRRVLAEPAFLENLPKTQPTPWLPNPAVVDAARRTERAKKKPTSNEYGRAVHNEPFGTSAWQKKSVYKTPNTYKNSPLARNFAPVFKSRPKSAGRFRDTNVPYEKHIWSSTGLHTTEARAQTRDRTYMTGGPRGYGVDWKF